MIPYNPADFMFSGQLPMRVIDITRDEANTIHNRQHRESHAYLSFIETSKHTSECMFFPNIYLYLRYHPINARLPWVLWYLGSVIRID